MISPETRDVGRIVAACLVVVAVVPLWLLLVRPWLVGRCVDDCLRANAFDAEPKCRWSCEESTRRLR